MNRKKMLAFAGALILLLGTVGTALALDAAYNRPNPLMDYVPQEIGIYDTRYDELDENACRECHGNSLADRHHLTDTVVINRECTPCHDTIPNPPGVNVYRNCVVDAPVGTGCHSWDNVNFYTNGWHHNTDLSGSENCTACHSPNLVAEIGPFKSFAAYPPSVVTPTPFSCENCHWDQPIEGNHPSSFDHFNIWGQPFGSEYSYGIPILGNFDTHHMGFKGNVASECYKCHSEDPNNPSWDPTNPELIRYCMICHDVATLHILEPHQNGDVPHVGEIAAWEAAGFHVQGVPDPPTNYTTFTADQQCFGCHADLIPDPPDVGFCDGTAPSINTTVDGITPNAGACTTIVLLRGDFFGEEQFDSEIQMKKAGSLDPWTVVPAYSWTNTQLEFEIPCWTFDKANYNVRVVTACGNSNKVNFALKDWGTLLSLAPDSGPCNDGYLTLTGSGFGATKKVLPATPGETGIQRYIEVSASQGNFIAETLGTWSDTSVEFSFKNFYQDTNANYIKEGGEPVITKCAGSVGTWLGTWQVYFVTLYYEDTDLSGNYTTADTITQVTYSDPASFELTAEPVIFNISPVKVPFGAKFKVFGQNFGPFQTTGSVRIGGDADSKSATLGLGKELKIKFWSNTKIKPKLNKGQNYIGKKKYLWVEKDGMKSSRTVIKPQP